MLIVGCNVDRRLAGLPVPLGGNAASPPFLTTLPGVRSIAGGDGIGRAKGEKVFEQPFFSCNYVASAGKLRGRN